MFFETVLSLPTAFAVDVLVKATLLLTSVIAIDLCVRKGTAAMRHRVWAMAFVGLLLLPVLSCVIPEYRIAILPAAWFAHAPVSVSEPLSPEAMQISPAPTFEYSEPSHNAATLPIPRNRHAEETQLVAGVPAPAAFAPHLEPRSTPTPNTKETKQTPASNGWYLTIRILGLAWFIGCLIAISPLIQGVWRISHLNRKSPQVLDQEPIRTLAELCRRLGIFRPVRLLETEQSIVPMTWGLICPVVLLPASWRRWATERQRLVLLHELAHVKRFDVVTQSIARLAVSLYWFHPMAWYAIRRLRVERELACDDCVLMAGERPSQYAEQLLTIAREFQSLEMPPAVAMAQSSGLENRVRAMLDQARSHLPLNPRVAGGMLVMTIATLLLLAPLRLGAITPAAVIESVSVASVEEPKPAKSKSAKGQMHISGTVTSPDNQPLAGTRVTVLRKYLANPSWAVQYEKLLETTSDAAGRFEVDVPATSERFSNGHHFEEQRTIVHASKEGYGPDEADVETLKNSPNLQLATASKKIQGRFLDLEGKPIGGVKVKLVKIEKAGASIALWLENARNNPATLNDPRMMMAQPVGATNWPRLATFPSRGEITAFEILGPIEAQSDSNGEFTLAGIGDDRQATLLVESPTIATTWLHCVTYEMASVNMPIMDPRFRVGRTFGAKFDYSAEPTQWIQGTVRDKQAGTPLKDVVVSLHQFGDSLLSIEDFIQCTTDANGRYLLKGIPKAPEGSNGVKIRILPGAEQPYFRSEHPVPKSMGLEPVELNMELTKGIWIEGQVTDAKTKAPVPAMVAYYPRRENPKAENHEKWRLDLISMGYDDLIATDVSGRFRVPGLTGAGVLRVVAANDTEYQLADGLPPGIETSPRKYYHCDSAGNAMSELDIAPDVSLHRVDASEKTVLGQTGAWNGDGLLEMLVKNEATSKRLASRLCEMFFGENVVDDEARAELAEGMRKKGLNIEWGVSTILRSRLFFSKANIRSRIACPVELVVGTVRALEMQHDPPSTLLLAAELRKLGQDLFHPPNVFGWPEGREWIHTRSVLARYRFADSLLAGKFYASSHSAFDFEQLAFQHGKSKQREQVLEFYFQLISNMPSEVHLKGRDAGSKVTEMDSIPQIVTRMLTEPEYQLS